MVASNAPNTPVLERLTPSQPKSIGFNSCVRLILYEAGRVCKLTLSQTLESDHYVCVRQEGANPGNPEVIIIDLKNNNDIMKRPIKADSAIMHWNKQVIALKAQSRTLQIFDLDKKQKLKSNSMIEDVVFWKWFSPESLGMVTDTAVFHWNVYDPAQLAPIKIFERNANLNVSGSVPWQKTLLMLIF